MDTRIPTSVRPILNDYIVIFNETFPNMLEGFYLHGSIALDAYCQGMSDIDFMAIVNRPFTEEELMVLTNIHLALHNQSKTIVMDGSYIVREEIGKKPTAATKCFYVNEGKVQQSNHEMNPVTWWILKNKGITVFGTDLTTFHFEVDDNNLAYYVLTNMNHYWFNRMNTLKKYKKVSPFLSNKFIDQEIQWSITGLLRQFYTLKEHGIISKVEAAKYAIEVMPVRWHPIIQESISIREGLKLRYIKSKTQRVNDTIDCMEYIINECNHIQQWNEQFVKQDM